MVRMIVSASILTAIFVVGMILYLNDPADEPINGGVAEETIEINLNEARRIFDAGQGIFIDARPPWAYEAGHIPGAINYPIGTANQEDFHEQMASWSTEQIIVVYCAGEGCKTSILLARNFRDKRGFSKARAFVGGWPTWIAAGYSINEEDIP